MHSSSVDTFKTILACFFKPKWYIQIPQVGFFIMVSAWRLSLGDSGFPWRLLTYIATNKHRPLSDSCWIQANISVLTNFACAIQEHFHQRIQIMNQMTFRNAGSTDMKTDCSGIWLTERKDAAISFC
jgi:hypothetical protein